MRSGHVLLMVASVVSIGFLVGCVQSPMESGAASSAPNNAGAKSMMSKGAQGMDVAPPSAVEQIRDAFRKLTNDALTPGGLEDLTAWLADADRKRLVSLTNNSGHDADFDELVMRIRRDWKNKYGNDFKLGNVDKILSDVELTGLADKGDFQKVVAVLPENDSFSGGNEIKISLVREGGSWKIDIPDSVTSAMLKAGLIQRLEMVEQLKDRWPTDQNQAYRLVARHVLQGVSEAR